MDMTDSLDHYAPSLPARRQTRRTRSLCYRPEFNKLISERADNPSLGFGVLLGDAMACSLSGCTLL